MTRPVTIRGEVYPSQRAAADALGLTPLTIGNARKAGRLDQVGLSHNPGDWSSKPLTLAGTEYRSRREAARAIGVTESQLGNFLVVAKKLGLAF